MGCEPWAPTRDQVESEGRLLLALQHQRMLYERDGEGEAEDGKGKEVEDVPLRCDRARHALRHAHTEGAHTEGAHTEGAHTEGAPASSCM